MILTETAFIAAAGQGTRMAPLTDTLPKPLVRLGDRPILDYIFDHLRKSRISRVIVNACHHADKLESYLDTIHEPHITCVREDPLLETGGGLANVRHLIGDKPFLMINGDAFWTDGPDGAALERLGRSFNPDKMDILLLLIPVKNMHLTQGIGDYDFLEDGTIKRNRQKTGTHMFTGLRIIHPRILEGMKQGIYSFLEQMDEAESKGRLYGLEHDGIWHHISTPQDVDTIARAL